MEVEGDGEDVEGVVVEVCVESGVWEVVDGEVSWFVELEKINVVKYSLAVVVLGIEFGVVKVVESNPDDDASKRGKK